MTSLVIEHQCPQCGAPTELTETDRLLTCGYCRVKSYRTTHGYIRYIIPPHAPAGKDLIYFPYWRFKGMLFSCMPKKIESRFIDTSYQALDSSNFPCNIGFRGQTQKLRFAVAETEGTFIKSRVPFDDIFSRLCENYSPVPASSILHQEFIGETISLIYSPFYFDTKLMDAVINEPVSKISPEDLPDGFLQTDRHLPPVHFLAALCPLCGRDLNGERDCLVLTCENCRSAWWEKGGKLVQIRTAHFSEKGDAWVYLPFWRIQADVAPIRLKTFADLVKTANMPRVIQPGWDKIPFYFWNPAFKVKPQSYLTIASNVTLKQPMEKSVAGPPLGRAHSVTLSLEEALESLKLTLANFMHPLERRAHFIPQIDIQPRRFQLVYIPFQDTRLELIQPRLNLGVNKSMLAHAGNL